jgi:hypothetical protein
MIILCIKKTALTKKEFKIIKTSRWVTLIEAETNKTFNLNRVGTNKGKILT